MALKLEVALDIPILAGKLAPLQTIQVLWANSDLSHNLHKMIATFNKILRHQGGPMTRPLIQSAYVGGLSRRQVLHRGTLFIATSLSPSLGWSHHSSRSLRLHNALTREDLKLEYWVEGEFVPDALKTLNDFLRDPHNGKVTEIDPKLFHFIYDIANELGASGTINIMSGYRSPATNDRLRRRNSAAAKGSFHVKGKAVDIRIPGYSTNSVRRVALDLRQGGVGYYPRSKYVHIDTGPVRSWRHA